MQMLKIMWISSADIHSTYTRDRRDVDSLTFANAAISTDVYFQYLRMRVMIKIMQIYNPPLIPIFISVGKRSFFTLGPPPPSP